MSTTRSSSALLALLLPAFLLAGAVAELVQAQSPSQARLAKQRDGKLQLPYLKHVDWVLRFADAKARAKKLGRPIFAYFTRSDERCMNSISLECGVFAEEGFKQFAQKVVPFCHITTKVKGDPDPDLLAKTGGRAWPRIVFMDATGKVTYVVSGERLSDCEKGLKELAELEALRKRVAGKDRHARYPYLKKQLELQHVDFATARKRLKSMGRLKNAQKAELAPLLLRAEVHQMVRRTRASKKARAKTGEKFARMKKAGRVPIRDALRPFFEHILDYAEARKKPELYEESLDTLKQEFPEVDWKAHAKTLRRIRS